MTLVTAVFLLGSPVSFAQFQPRRATAGTHTARAHGRGGEVKVDITVDEAD